MKKNLFLFLFLFPSCAFCQATHEIKDGRTLIEAMHAQYKNKWYANVTFAQAAIFYKDGKVEKEEVWYEAISGQHGLVIKLRDLNGGDGVMYSGDSQYVWRDNRLVTRAKRLNELFVLGFTVYADEPAITIAKLKGVGYDFDKFEMQETNGKTEFVIGDKEGPRFWIDKNRLLFTRLQKKDGEGRTIEMQFNNYQMLGKGWLAEEVVFLTNGEVTFREIYRDIRMEKKLPFEFVPPKDFSKLRW